MDSPLQPEPPEVLDALYRQFRDYFTLAEKRRRWSLANDIPWDQCNRSLPPAIADVVATFCAVELYLPDYLSKLLPQVRATRGRAWMLANWGYEECKHSMALEDWLLRSGQFTDEQMSDLHRDVFANEWELPYDNGRGMLCYTAFQELATQIHYRRLREVVQREGGCPALERVLMLISIDEAAHADFFCRVLQVYLHYDRPATLDQLRRVIDTFRMPSVHLLSDSTHRIAEVQRLHIFDEEIYFKLVYQPILTKLGVTRKELRNRPSRELSVPLAGVSAAP